MDRHAGVLARHRRLLLRFGADTLVAMVVHAVYDAGRHSFQSRNHPALAWLIAHAFGNFLGAGVRVEASMQPFVANLMDQDADDLAAYYASLSPCP